MGEQKEKPEIIQVAQLLNCLPEKKIGNRFQGGNCPGGHESKNGKCWIIYEDTQSCFCFHCGAGGDSWELIKAALKCSFSDAVYWAREQGLITGNGFSDPRYAELRKVHQILTDASKFFHGNLKDYSHLKTHYGLSDETIKQYHVGYAPIDKNALKKHLVALGHDLADIKKSGLLGKYDDSFFQGQFIFPYWNSGLVKYFIGRKTEETPDSKHSKYEKLPTTDVVKNEFFYGEDSVRGKDTVYVTEGVTDCLTALQHGLPSISPVTTQFRKSDHAKLLSLVKGKRVFLVPDNEENEAGMKGAQETLSFLKNNGIEACIITLPRPAGKEKADFNEYVRDKGIDAFHKLVKEQSPKSINDIPKFVFTASDFIKISFPTKKTILFPWAKEFSIIMIYGPRGIGKTMFAVSLLASIVSGRALGPWEIQTSVNCLYLDGEMPPQDTVERLQYLFEQEMDNKLFIYNDSYLTSLGLPGANLLNDDWRKALKNLLIKNNIKVWVVDNIASLAPGIDENSKQEWDPINKWFLELRAGGITTVFLHHANKDGGQRGTSGREDNIDISILLDWPKNYQKEDGTRFVVKFEKARIRHADLHLIADTEFWLQTDEEGHYVWTFSALKKQNKIQVIKMLDEGMTSKDIAKELSISPGRVSQLRAEAFRAGLITESGKLTQNGFAHVQKS